VPNVLSTTNRVRLETSLLIQFNELHQIAAAIACVTNSMTKKTPR